MIIKKELYDHCFKFVELRFASIQKTLNEIAESLTTETKSSAGDKHETGRAMLQLEREKTGNQLSEIQKTKETLLKIDTSSVNELVSLGSVVYTSQANYYIAISAGEIEINAIRYYAISPDTPIGKLILGKKTNDTINFRDQIFKITKVL